MMVKFQYKKVSEFVRPGKCFSTRYEENIDKIINNADEIEKNSNQILDFTQEVKSMNNENKVLIVETLWRIIYSNKKADIYETSLMRRLAGLLYIDNKIMGDIKDKIKRENL